MSRIAILWTHLSGYFNASLTELKRRGISLFVSAYTSSSKAPFADEAFRWLENEKYLSWNGGAVDYMSMLRELEKFNPNVILVSGWNQFAYLRAARRFKGRAIRVLCLDTPWLGTLRQWVGRLSSRYWLNSLFERSFVPGERQVQMAMHLGFSPANVIQGLYAPDTDRIIAMAPSTISRKRQFLFVGRVSHEKGIQVLADADREYRSSIANPWSLIIVGTGPLMDILRGIEGVDIRGFVQPESLPHLLYEASCLVAPSIVEPWGVQISEGVTAGLPIISTTACGSAVHLVRNGFNGYLVSPRDPSDLVRAMLAIHNCSSLETYSAHSQQLAGQFTPYIWAENLIQSCMSAPL
jgi:glycosyltransferase involved in cell wall biosynthesis